MKRASWYSRQRIFNKLTREPGFPRNAAANHLTEAASLEGVAASLAFFRKHHKTVALGTFPATTDPFWRAEYFRRCLKSPTSRTTSRLLGRCRPKQWTTQTEMTGLRRVCRIQTRSQ